MKLFLGMGSDFADEKLRFAAQVGVDGVVGSPTATEQDRGYYDFATLANLRTKVASFGLELYAIRVPPWTWTYKWMLGLPGRDEQLENLRQTLRHMGAAGIPIFCYNMHALRFYRTTSHAPGRAGTTATGYDHELGSRAPLMAAGPGIDTSLIPESHRRPIGDDEMWANLAYFLEAAVPVAAEAGVKLALHPDDPPVPSIGGVARIIRSPEAYRRVLEMAPDPCHGIAFCQGCFAEMGADVPAEIRYFGSRNRIFFVDFRNIRGTPERFSETFPDEGDVDMAEAMRAYKEVGFDGPLCPDHTVRIDGDSSWGHRYWAYAVGHLKGLAQATGM